MGLQKAIVEKIREKKADFVIGLNNKPPTLAADMTALWNEGISYDYEGVVTDLHVTSEKARSGVE